MLQLAPDREGVKMHFSGKILLNKVFKVDFRRKNIYVYFTPILHVN